MNDSNIVYQARLHWILFFWPALFLCLAVYFAVEFVQLRPIAALIAAFALLWGLMFWMTYQFSVLTIKKKQVILRTGVFVRQTIDIPLNKIETIDIRQSLLGSIFQYGLLVITGTGGTRQAINYLSKPLTCRRYIEQLMHN